MIKDDYEMIEHSFDDTIEIVPIFDVHIGASSFMEKEFKETIEYIKNNKNVYCVIGGDLIDNAVLVGKNLGIFDNTLSPMQQIEKAIELLKPIKNKILSICSGNHEFRSEKIAGINPLLIISSELGLQDVYRNALNIIKIKLGKREEHQRATYVVLVHHGSGTDSSALKKDYSYISTFDGADVIVTGHVHKGKFEQNLRHVIDTHNNKLVNKVITTIIANSYLDDSDYSIKAMMGGTPHSLIRFQLNKSQNKKVSIYVD